MELRGGMKRIDVPHGERRSYANEGGLDALTALAEIASEELVTVEGKRIEEVIAERMGLSNPGSDEAQDQVLDFLERTAEVLKTAVHIEYIRPGSYVLDTTPLPTHSEPA